ncbi:MAG: hypothetical protein PHR96_02380 [Clostridia bacterium]|nr:hypothetical protein [Clostridia bacterium]
MNIQNKENIKLTNDVIWITYIDDDGQVKSVPLKSFQRIAKKRGWKPNKLE